MNWFKVSLMLCLSVGLGDVQAQWNAIAGYDFSNADAAPVNVILNDYNLLTNPTESFKDLRVLHGFTAGLRYHYQLGAFEMYYNRRFSRRIADQLDLPRSSTNTLTNADFFYEIRAFSIASEFGGVIRIGASMDYNTYLMEMDYEVASQRDVKVKQRPLGSRFFIGTHIKNRPNLSFSVRAFYQVLWSDISTQALIEGLTLADGSCDDCVYRPRTIGFSIIINNGLQ